MKTIVEIDESARTYIGPWEWPDDATLGEGVMMLSDAIAQGYRPAPPPPLPVPASVAKWAFLLIVRRMGKETALKAALAAYTGANADRVRAKWEASEIVERDGPTVDALGAAIGLTKAQVDQAFRDAEREENA